MLNCVLNTLSPTTLLRICGGTVGGQVCYTLCSAHVSVCVCGVVGGQVCYTLCTAHVSVCVPPPSS